MKSRNTPSYMLLFVLTLMMLGSFPIGNQNMDYIGDSYGNDSFDPEVMSSILSESFPIPKSIDDYSLTSSHGIITITSNSEFVALRDSESWLGSGNETHPIIITDYNFTATTDDLISISNTNLHFVIERNYFKVPTENYNGITLTNVTNGIIRENYFGITSFPIYFAGANFTTINSNHITGLSGLYINSGNNNTIEANYFSNEATSITLFSSSTYFNRIFNNSIYGSSTGILIHGASVNNITLNKFTHIQVYSIRVTQFSVDKPYHNLLLDNIILDSNGATGIFLTSYAYNNTVQGNTLHNVSTSIRSSYSDGNRIFDNTITNTTQGISIEYSQWNEVYSNQMSNVTNGALSAYSLFIYHAGNNTFSNHYAVDADNGAYLYYSDDNTLYNNTFTQVLSNGINVQGSSYNRINDNTVIGGNNGIYFTASSWNNTLNGNILRLQTYGIQIMSTSHYNTLIENDIENATQYGIYSDSSSGLVLYNNSIINSGVTGIRLATTSHNVISNNYIVNNGQYGIYLDTDLDTILHKNFIQNHTSYGAYIFSSNRLNFTQNVFTNNSNGLTLINSDLGNIIDNVFTNNTDTAFGLEGADGTNVLDNLFEDNGLHSIHLTITNVAFIVNNTIEQTNQYGLKIDSGTLTTYVINNSITYSSSYGIWLASNMNLIRGNNITHSGVGIFTNNADSNSIEYNLIQYNDDGIILLDSDSNTILLNTIHNNSHYGIISNSSFSQTSNGNMIYNNTIISNGVYGVYLDTETYTTEVKWNDFIANGVHGGDANPSGYGNIWDSNFWDDWDQAQAQYDINFDTTDYNPFVYPINPTFIHFLLSASIIDPQAGITYSTNLDISWNAACDSDGHPISYSLFYSNDSEVSWYFIVENLTLTSYSWNTTGLEEGSNYQVMLVSTDSLNISAQTVSGTFGIDSQAPRLGTVPTNFTVELSFDPLPIQTFSAYDTNPAVAYIEWQGYAMSEYIDWENDTITYLDLPEPSVTYGVGVHELYLVVTDISGQETRYLYYITVIDTVDPVMVIPETNQTFELGPHDNKLAWFASDLAAGKYEVYINDSLDFTGTWFSNIEVGIIVDNYTVGVYNVTIVFYDTSNNSLTHSINMTIEDTTAPSIFASPEYIVVEFGTSGNSINWTLIEFDPSSYDVFIDSVFNQTIIYSNGTVVLDIDGMALGSYNLSVVFYDNSGNSVSDSVLIDVRDTIAPDITEHPDIILEYGVTGFDIEWNASDLLPDNYTVYMDDIEWDGGTWSNGLNIRVLVDGLSKGNHSLTIVVADTSNNQAIDELTITIHDTIAPTWLQNPDDQVLELGSVFLYQVNASDLSSLSYSIDDTYNFIMNSVTGLITNATSLDLGEYNLDIFATDSSGNVLVTSITVFVQDTTSPVIVTSSEDYEYEFGTTDHSVFWMAYDIDPANYTIFLDGSLAVSDEWHSNTSVIFGVDSLDVGSHTIEIRFYDTSMNLVSNIIHITVVEPSSTSSTETTSSPTTPPTVDSSMLLLLGGGVAGIAFIIVVIVGYKKLKQ